MNRASLVLLALTCMGSSIGFGCGSADGGSPGTPIDASELDGGDAFADAFEAAAEASIRDDGSSEATVTADAIAEAAADCGSWKGITRYTCSPDGTERGKCVGGVASVESCTRGCLRESSGDDVCLGAAGTASWSCTGSYGTTKSTDGDYYLTSFGCWTDAAGAVHLDSGDNCIPTCLDKAIAKGLCPPGSAGPACEEKIDWYTADGARFGCLARLRITNPKNGKSVIAVALDYGPACSVEARVSKTALDASGRVDQYLFGGDMGITDKALVHVVEVDESTPLGPVP
jgi:hypothetical protein